MTAPTPEQMRALARRGPGPDESAGWASDVRVALRAAANKLENQQDWMDHSHPVDIDDLAKQMIDSAGEEADRLRTVIENAPHADDCAARIPMHFHKAWRCTCWKADAL